MLRRLIIMRHAKSSWADPGMCDFDRPLNARGQAAAPAIGQRLKAAQYNAAVVLASTATRVRETLDLLQPAWDNDSHVIWEKQLYLASRELLLHHVSALDVEWSSVMIVGHNPGLSELVSHLTASEIEMPTAAVAILECEAVDWSTSVRQRPWRQVEHWTPKD